MRHRYSVLPGVTGLCLLLLGTVPVSGQTAKVPAKTSAMKRLTDGHPDLQGIYDVATLTPVDRRGTNLILTKEEATKLEAEAAQLKAAADQAINPPPHAPPNAAHRTAPPPRTPRQ